MKLQTSILNYLKPRAYVVNVITAGDNGSPDILCCYRGRFVGIEVKDEGDEERKLQNFCIKQIIKREGFATVAWSVKDVKDTLARVDCLIELGVSK